jgi:hypothetical protein
MSVTTLYQKLAIYYQMFPALLALMDDIETQGFKGGQLLSALYENC